MHSIDIAESSKKTYARQLKQFTNWLYDTGCVERLPILDRNDILEFKVHQISCRKSSNTVSGYLTAVRAFFSWLEAEKVYPKIARNIRAPKKARGHRKDCLTTDQIRRVLAGIDTTRLIGLRDYALINLLVRTGLRSIEVSRTLVGDLRQESGEAVLWVQGKGRDAKDG